MKKPKIRFKGYQEDWEQRKLVDLVDRVTRKNQDLVSELPLTISAQYGLIDQNEFFDKRVASKDVSGYYLIENGEFAYNKSTSTDAPWGAIKRLDRYENGVLSTLYIVFGIKENNPVDSDFLVSYYSTNLWHKGIHEIAAEGARNHGLLNIAPADFFETKLMIPQDIEEQKKIGKYFEELERLITLHHRKYMKYADLSVFDWEQRKFADFTWDAGKRNKEDLDLEPYAITNEHGFIRQRDAHDDFGYMKDTDRKAYNIVQPNSFAYNPARINVGSIGYYKGVENVIVSSLYEVFQTDNYVNDRFLWHWLKSDEFPRWIEKLQEGSVRLYFYYDKLCECQLYMPSLEEQEKIATFLDDLDHLITLHQRKCEETKTLKKYMLQKMFPQNGHSVPEIRFSGFTEDWEQRKLVDLVDRVTRKNQDLVSELPLTISAQYGLIDQNEFFDKRVASKDVSGYYLIENGEFAYNKSTSTDAPWGAIKRLDRYENGVLSTLYIVFGIKENNPVDSDFLVSYYSTNLWHKGIHEIAAEGARNHGLLNIAPADFFETKLMIPQDIEEQKKIGKYFEELERLITLHQHKCEELQNIKKFMLKNMFI
ncbi:MAG: restriction endonuclease subunit S [[Ruminococcus] lactaris]